MTPQISLALLVLVCIGLAVWLGWKAVFLALGCFTVAALIYFHYRDKPNDGNEFAGVVLCVSMVAGFTIIGALILVQVFRHIAWV